MSAKQMVTRLIKGFRDDIDTCQEIEDALIEQRIYLGAANSEKLEVINEKIDEKCERLNDSNKDREEVMRFFGLDLHRSDILTLSKKLPESVSSEIMGLFHRLEVHMDRCKNLNDRNGQVLAEQQARIDQLLGKDSTSYSEMAG